MNPARSLAPAVESGHLDHVWVYLAAPTLGAVLAVGTCVAVHGRPCCCATGREMAPCPTGGG
jgi:aquaporin Z